MLRLHVRRCVVIAALWGLITCSALAVVYVAHCARTATHELEMLRHRAADLHVESGQYLLEKSSLSAYSRIEEQAVQKLEMTVPDPDQVVLVKP